MLQKLTSNHFQPYLDHTFHIHLDTGQQMAVQLTSISDLGAAPQDNSARQPFSLTFRGPGDVILPQRIYHVDHETLGAHDIFLVPIGSDGTGIQYEALFA